MAQTSQGCLYFNAVRIGGVTLVELLLSIAIAAILITLAVPALDAAMTSAKLGSASNSFLSSLYLARSEAIKRNSRTVVCKSADGANCTSSGHWDQGWIIFHDVNNDAQADSGEQVILRTTSLHSDIAMQGNTPVSRYVSYSPTGSAMYVSGAFQAGTVTTCRVSANGGETRHIIISATGRPRIQKSTTSICP